MSKVRGKDGKSAWPDEWYSLHQVNFVWWSWTMRWSKKTKENGKMSVCVVKQVEATNLCQFGDVHLPCPADPHLYLDRSKCKTEVNNEKVKYQHNNQQNLRGRVEWDGGHSSVLPQDGSSPQVTLWVTLDKDPLVCYWQKPLAPLHLEVMHLLKCLTLMTTLLFSPQISAARLLSRLPPPPASSQPSPLDSDLLWFRSFCCNGLAKDTSSLCRWLFFVNLDNTKLS